MQQIIPVLRNGNQRIIILPIEYDVDEMYLYSDHKGSLTLSSQPFNQDIAPSNNRRNFGFMKGKIQIPDNFDEIYSDEIAEMFEGKYENSTR
ncbi:hypothetical protein ACWA5Z_00790 [Testudinibacter sp. P80/BLE/0925]|uniref:hypothetical protein n=1 Tax=Testudinibacter sp. TW-1 TaxID=3417757 RepID=UPI003D35AF2D